ncbi:hypothetical protein [Nonomuraea africana]|uniref:hypothetical protein n=1 Tax=Nonomuraea africana TaxID=46171 RepID=UPI0033F70403
MRRVTALLALTLVAGCGGTAAETAAPSPGGQGVEQRKEAEMATCMKQKGFKYVAYVRPPVQLSDQRKKASSGDYESMRAERAKHGFGHFSLYVYPKEHPNPMVKPDNPDIDPNWAIQGSLSEEQRKAYQSAKDACYAAALKKVTGKDVKSVIDHYDVAEKARDQALARELDTDPSLAEKAQVMADCLKGKGYRVGKTNPTAIAERGTAEIRAQVVEIGKTDDIDDSKLTPGQYYEPSLTAEEARPYLTKEIKVALDDLECGKDFYAAYLPKQQEIFKRIDAEFGMTGWS